MGHLGARKRGEVWMFCGLDGNMGYFLYALGNLGNNSTIIIDLHWLCNEWKKGNVSLTSKKGRKEDLGNDRPASLTSVPGKMVEQIL